MIATSGFLVALECTKFVFSALPDLLARLRGPTSKGNGRGGRREKKIKRRDEGNGRDRPPLRKFLDPPSVECGLSAGHRVIIPVENMIFCAFQKARSKSKLGVVVGPARCICNHGQSLRSSTSPTVLFVFVMSLILYHSECSGFN